MKIISVDYFPGGSYEPVVGTFYPNRPSSFRLRLVKQPASNVFVEFTGKRRVEVIVEWHSSGEKTNKEVAAIRIFVLTKRRISVPSITIYSQLALKQRQRCLNVVAIA